jgi:exopolyphosphatase/guanosine-5'-triphosphate,3'-diphosphate pyrophosphatase
VKPVRRAVIDVGTNSVKLLVADVAGHFIQPVHEESKQTRLGRGFYDTHRLQPGPIAATASAVAAFVEVAREHKAGAIRVVATSAAREAVNSEELTSAVALASGLRVEVISGDQEAEWGFQGVTTDPQFARAPLLLMDLGGGSTEFTLGRGEHKHFRQSFPLGAVRLLEKTPHDDPPQPEQLVHCNQVVREFLQREIRPRLEPALRREMKIGEADSQLLLVGVGGTASILACMEAQLNTFDRARVEAVRLGLARLTWHVQRLWSLPLEERKKIVGLPKNRADVILTGAAIYEAVMEQFGFRELRISTRGLRFAALMTPLQPNDDC